MGLLERDRELAGLSVWFDSVAERAGCVVLVGGEAGVGKTTLMRQFSRQHSARVLWGACDALLTPRPLAPLHDVARQTKGALLEALTSGATRDAVFASALEELERVKTLLIFEDAHWADEATLDLLKYLGRRALRTHTMLAVTYRDDEIGARHPLRMVMGDLPRDSTHRILLAPLSESAVAQLAAQAGRPAKDLHRITGGNPLFVTELLAGPADRVPATVRDAVLARVGRLPPAAQELAELVCVIPGRTESWLLQQAASPSEQAIEACLAIGMVRYEDGSLAFRHELVRRALEDSLSATRLRTLHAKALAILATRADISGARLAHHASGASNADAVLRYAPIAAAQAAFVGGHREAAAHYELALRFAASLAPAELADLQERLAYESHLTGHHDRAIEIQRSALAIWRTIGLRMKEGQSLRSLSRMSWFAGRLVEAKQLGMDAVTALEALPAGPELALAYCNRADLDMEDHETDSAIDWAQRALALAELLGKIEIASDALNTLGTARLIEGDVSGWTDLLRSLPLALSAQLDERVGSTYTNLAAMAVSTRQYEQASRYLETGLAYCKERDLDSVWLYLLAYRARMRFERGEWNGAGDDAEAVLQHPCTTPITRIPTLRTLGHLRVRRGDPEASAPLTEAQELNGPAPQLQRIGTLAAVRAEVAWLADDRQGVIREVRPVYELLHGKRDPRMKGELAAWLWRVGNLEEHPTNIAQPYGLEIAGDWRGAARRWQALGCPYEHACMLAWYGAESDQREALLIFEQLGAAPAAQAIRRQLRAQGVRGIPRGSRLSTRLNPLGLTRREAEILALLSLGLRNSTIAKRLFVSTKTVDHHVSAVLSKLGVPSRAAAVAMARQLSDQQGQNSTRPVGIKGSGTLKVTAARASRAPR